MTVRAAITPTVGRSYINRAGAVLRCVDKQCFSYPTGTFCFFVCVIERMANGDAPELEHKVTVMSGGYYLPNARPHDLDLVTEVADIRRVAA